MMTHMSKTALRGIRGATTVHNNTKSNILEETKILITHMMKLNNVKPEDIASIFFSVTKDLDATFPAKAARELNLSFTPLLCLNEMDMPTGITKCVRILMHVNTSLTQQDIHPVYLNDAVSLRPEFAI